MLSESAASSSSPRCWVSISERTQAEWGRVVSGEGVEGSDLMFLILGEDDPVAIVPISRGPIRSIYFIVRTALQGFECLLLALSLYFRGSVCKKKAHKKG